jgi:AcrR family transcriptional regulator
MVAVDSENLTRVGTVAAAGVGALALYDPTVPTAHWTQPSAKRVMAAGSDQRLRRSVILATIRRLLIERGCNGITIRRIAEASGFAVGTIYNLVGSRNEAITEAISEFTLFVGRTASPRPDDPNSVVRIIDHWLGATAATPELCRQVNLIHFSESRFIYNKSREQQLAGVYNFLRLQQRYGVITAEADVQHLSENLVFLSSAFFQEWADRCFSLDELHQKVRSSCASLLIDKLAHEHRAAVILWGKSATPHALADA